MRVKSTFIIFALLCSALLKAQTATDAFRYSQEQLIGSARYTAMAGAFGALGGDFSAVVDNPAGAAVFINSEIGLSAEFLNDNLEAQYGGTSKKMEHTRFDIQQFGMVFPLNDTREDSDWPRIAFAFNYQRKNDFDKTFNAVGTSNQGIDEYFLYYANGLELYNLSLANDETVSGVYQYLGDQVGYGVQQAYLGYQAYIIDPISNDLNETRYQSNAQYNSVNHDYFFRSNGAHKKYSFTMSGQFRNKLYLGISINSHRILYKQNDDLEEYGYGNNSILDAVRFNNQLNTIGTGVSVQLGGIARFDSGLRLGLSYHSPTWLNLYDETSQFLVSDYYSQNGLISLTTEPNIINSYPEYNLRLPSKMTYSAAYTFGENGLISVDYSTRNYGNASYQEEANSNYFSNINLQIQQQYAASTRLAVGGEYRIGSISLRGGYFNETDRIALTNSGSTGYTLGLGYQWGGNAFGVSLINQENTLTQKLYSEGLTNSIILNNNPLQITFSYNFKL